MDFRTISAGDFDANLELPFSNATLQADSFFRTGFFFDPVLGAVFDRGRITSQHLSLEYTGNDAIVGLDATIAVRSANQFNYPAEGVLSFGTAGLREGEFAVTLRPSDEHGNVTQDASLFAVAEAIVESPGGGVVLRTSDLLGSAGVFPVDEVVAIRIEIQQDATRLWLNGALASEMPGGDFALHPHEALRIGAQEGVPVASPDGQSLTQGNFGLSGSFQTLSFGDSVATPPGTLPISISQANGIPGTVFELDVVDPMPSASYVWSFEDGETRTGPSVTRQFGEGGVFVGNVSELDAGGNTTAENTFILTVFETFGEDVTGDPYPALPGDVDDDGTLSIRDALLIRQALTGVTPLPDPEAGRRADFDLDRQVTAVDAELLTEALLSDSGFPTRVIPDAGQPGATVTVFAPALLDPIARVEIEFDGFPAVPAERIALGQVQAFVPLDVLTPGAFTDTGGQTSITLLIDGQPAEVLAFTVLDADPIDPTDPLADMREMLTLAQSLRQPVLDLAASTSTNPVFAELGYTPADIDALLLAVQVLYDELALLETGFVDSMSSLDPQRQQAVARILNAGGFQSALEEVRLASLLIDDIYDPSGSIGGFRFTAADRNLICQLERVRMAVDTANSWVGTGCAIVSAVGTACILFPFDGPLCDIAALTAAASLCAKYAVASELAGELLSLFPGFSNELFLEIDVDTSVMPVTATITPRLGISNNICANVTGDLLSKVRARVVQRVKRFPPIQAIIAVLQLIPDDFIDINDVIDSQLDALLGRVGLDAVLQSIQTELCSRIPGANDAFQAPLDARDVTVTASMSGGTIQQTRDAIIYTCPSDPDPSGPGTIDLDISFALCGSASAAATAAIPCEATQNVVVTIGDNGPANDDIFEASVDGQVVVTMNAPTRSISGSIELAPGTYTLRMRGLAAPDGIGTYFVRVSGATLAGPGGCGSSCTQASGTDLSAGQVFSWTLTVPGSGN